VHITCIPGTGGAQILIFDPLPAMTKHNKKDFAHKQTLFASPR